MTIVLSTFSSEQCCQQLPHFLYQRSVFFQCKCFATADGILEVLGKNGHPKEFMMREAAKAQTEKKSEH